MFKVKISASDSYGGGTIDDVNATFNVASKDEVNEYIDKVNDFNDGDDEDTKLMETLFNNWYEAHSDEYDSYDDAREDWDDGLGVSMGWSLDIDVIDDNGNNPIPEDFVDEISRIYPHI